MWFTAPMWMIWMIFGWDFRPQRTSNKTIEQNERAVKR